MEGYQQNVVNEKRELDAKIERLVKFVDTLTYEDIGIVEQNRMQRQLSAMREYSFVLGQRIDSFRGDVV